MEIIEEPGLPPMKKGAGRRGVYEPLFVRARERDGKWIAAKFTDLSPSTIPSIATRIRQGKVQGAMENEFEARADGDTIWVRYIGENLRELPSDEEE